jgi:AraC-like DNA-binding protein
MHTHIVDKAKNKLLNSEDPISQIAFSLGFEYPQHFSKVFKTNAGVSPKQFRNLN